MRLFYIVVFLLIGLPAVSGQSHNEVLPYSDFDKQLSISKVKSNRELIIHIIDNFGSDYYKATDSLFFTEAEKSSYLSNLPRLLSYVMYQLSTVLVSSDKNNEAIIPFESMSYDMIRESVLDNVLKASNFYMEKKVVRNTEMSQVLLPITIMEDYLAEFRNFRTRIGLPLVVKKNEERKQQTQSSIFAESIDADGLTTEQWIALNRYDPDVRHGYWNIHRDIRQYNFFQLSEMIKQEKINVRSGNAAPLKEYTGVVEGIEYKYFRQSPKRLSFLFSSDEELIRNLIDWIIFINSGNETKLSEIFTMGLRVASYHKNEAIQMSFDYIKFRTIMDRYNHAVLLKYSDSFFDGVNFKNVIIDKVFISRENRIVFTVKSNEAIRPDSAIQLINVTGDLMSRIKSLVDTMRTNENDYDSKSLNLFKF